MHPDPNSNASDNKIKPQTLTIALVSSDCHNRLVHGTWWVDLKKQIYSLTVLQARIPK